MTNTRAAPLVDCNTFTGNFTAGAENDNGAIAIYSELIALMKLIIFPLARWASNSEQLKARIPRYRQKS